MNIQLFLDNQEVDLGQDVVVPMNKTYSNLYSPMNIIIEYSKQIRIPITQKNNRVLGNSYRLDRRVVEGDKNIGYYLDPLKRIPARLIHNGKTVLDGYAKFVSASYSNTSKCYNLNLFGIIGDVFQKLSDVVTSPTLLPDGKSTDYVLGDNLTGRILDKEYVYNSWMNENNKIGSGATDYDIIGFAPTHRGLYSEFSSDKVQITKDGETSIRPISEVLDEVWKKASDTSNEYNASEIIGDGYPDYKMNEYRSYMLKPYIYINQLFRMYQNQCRKLSDYKIELDEDWFNDANPYWSKMCYMLDSLDLNSGHVDEVHELISGTVNPGFVGTSTNYSYADYWVSDVIDESQLATKSTLATQPIEILMRGKYVSSATGTFLMARNTVIKITTQIVSGKDSNQISTTKVYWTRTSQLPYSAIAVPDGDEYSMENYVPFTVETSRSGSTYETTYKVHIPGIVLDDVRDGYVFMKVSAYMYNDLSSGGIWAFSTPSSTLIQPTKNDPNFSISTTVYYKDSWRTSTRVKLGDIYQSDKPLFNAILQYTKMFGLIWDVDYDAKTIKVVTRSNYFKKYIVEDWSNIVDKSSDFTIEPISFDTKYINFNYDEVGGYRYTDYRTKYGVEYGDKMISTSYEFNTETTNLYEGVDPSSASSKTFLSMPTLKNWNGRGVLIESMEDYSLPDLEDTDQTSTISINNWYLRGSNRTVGDPVWITDDSGLMIGNDDFCWYWDPSDNGGISTTSIPSLSIATEFGNRYYGGLFGTPKEDYTGDKLPTKAKDRYIFDLFWKDYIDEIYNHNSKKVTAYFNIDPTRYSDFKFNHLVALDNQLFLVNKIFDYNINSDDSTKCELIQINNIENLYNAYIFDGSENPSIPDDPDQPTEPETTYYSVTSNTEECELRYNESVKEGDKFVCTVVPSDGYIIDVDKTYVTMGGIQLDKSVINTNSNTITINQVTGDINMSVICKKGVVYYTASGNGYGCTLSYPKSIEAGSTFICNITPVFVDSTYDLNNSTIYMNDFYLIPSDYIDTLTNTITIPNVNGDIRLEIYCISNGGEVNPTPRPDDPTDTDTPIVPDTPSGEYTVNVTVVGGEVDTYPTSVNYGDGLTLNITPSEGRRIDTASSFITMGGTPLSITDYLIGNRIFITNVTGDVNISIICGFDIIDNPEKV